MMTRYPMTPMQLAFHHLGDLANPNSGELLTFAGHLCLDTLREAIRLAVSRHPLLNSRPVKRLGKWYWQPSPVPLPIDIAVHDTELEPSPELHTELWKNLWQSPLPQDGRPVRFTYTRGPVHSHLQICAPHSVTDACSGTRLAADIGQAYGALNSGTAYEPMVVPPLGAQGVKPLLSHLGFQERVKLMAQTAKLMLTDVVSDGAGLELPDPEHAAPTAVEVKEVASEVLQRTLRVARANGSTAHAFFLMALTKARRDFVGAESEQRPLRINDFATLRPFSDEAMAHAFDVLVVPHQVRIDPSWDERSGLQIISESLRAKKRGGILSEIYRLSLYGALARFLPLRLTAGLVFKLVNKSDLAVTNPGPVPFQDELVAYGNVPITDFVNFPHLLPPAKVVLIFSTFRGSLRIIQLYDPAVLPNGVGASLITPFLRHLEELLETFSPQVNSAANGDIADDQAAPNHRQPYVPDTWAAGNETSEGRTKHAL